jgi:hypothetical protein
MLQVGATGIEKEKEDEDTWLYVPELLLEFLDNKEFLLQLSN